MATNLTKSAGGAVRVLVDVTSRWAQTPLDGADTTIWLAASPDLDSVKAKFWHKRHEIRCRFREPAHIARISALVEQQIASTA